MNMEKDTKDAKNTNIFSGLEYLGFKDLSNIEIYKKCEVEKDDKTKSQKPKITEDMLLFNKKVVCPVCGNNFFGKYSKNKWLQNEDQGK